MPMVKCPKCGKDTWWGVWDYEGVKLCSWCGARLEVAVKDGAIKSVGIAK